MSRGLKSPRVVQVGGHCTTSTSLCGCSAKALFSVVRWLFAWSAMDFPTSSHKTNCCTAKWKSLCFRLHFTNFCSWWLCFSVGNVCLVVCSCASLALCDSCQSPLAASPHQISDYQNVHKMHFERGGRQGRAHLGESQQIVTANAKQPLALHISSSAL